MEPEQIRNFALLRSVVGFLGERDQAGWWPSAFFSPGSSAFLAPVVPRTEVLAKCTGVTRAAALVHDERIGVGRVYHLFRLPEEIEQRVHSALHDAELANCISEVTATRDSSLHWLRALAEVTGIGVGPTLVGDAEDLRIAKSWRTVASEYLRGLESELEVYPYFTDRA